MDDYPRINSSLLGKCVSKEDVENYKITEFKQITSWEEVMDCLLNRYPIAAGNNWNPERNFVTAKEILEHAKNNVKQIRPKQTVVYVNKHDYKELVEYSRKQEIEENRRKMINGEFDSKVKENDKSNENI